MANVRELDSALRGIKYKCMQAIDESTGKVDKEIISQQAALLKKWVEDFENLYVEEAKKAQIDPLEVYRGLKEMTKKGRDILGEAWTVYEILLDTTLQAGEAPWPTDFSTLPSGYVSGHTRTAFLAGLQTLYKNFSEYRKEVLKA